MGAGILPVTIMKGTIFFLLGRENHNNCWSDFGGSAHKYESVFETAIREGYEELDGFLGNKNKLEDIVTKNLISLCYSKKYTTFIFYVKPHILYTLPYYFNNHRNFLEEEHIINYDKEGLFEKKEVKLFSKKDLLVNYQEIRPFYREIVQQLLEIEKESFDKCI
jgi:8-oxo-dGTP pyrophosphatase MutT (NUDIX family)